MPASQQSTLPHDEATDELDAALAWHDGDAITAIRTSLEDCRRLREQAASRATGICGSVDERWFHSWLAAVRGATTVRRAGSSVLRPLFSSLLSPLGAVRMDAPSGLWPRRFARAWQRHAGQGH